MTDPQTPHLHRQSLIAITLSVFTVSAGYGIVLPILPFLIERLSGQGGTFTIGTNTGLLTGIYVLAVFLFAPFWGAVSDRCGRKPVIVLGLFGLAATMFMLAWVASLPVLYLGRFLSGTFSAAIAPPIFALLGDLAPNPSWRARHFALANVAGSLGFFVGPMIGGLAVRSSQSLFGDAQGKALSAPFVAAAVLAGLALIMVLLAPRFSKLQGKEDPASETQKWDRSAAFRLLAIAFAISYAVGSFEVGLSLQGKVLGLDAAHIGAIFAECSLVMAIMQAFIFSPLIKPDVTRRFISPALAVLFLGLVVAVPIEYDRLMAVATALVAASAGVLSPVTAYWASLGSGKRQGSSLGRMTAFSSLGQATGSAAAGLLFGGRSLSIAEFFLPILVVSVAFLLSIPLAKRLGALTHKPT